MKKNFGCWAYISDGFATIDEKCKKQCKDCKKRYPEKGKIVLLHVDYKPYPK